MGRKPCCEKQGLNRGSWTAMEDKILTDYISIHGEGQWRNLPLKAGLKRCGKSCRLRWLNYLRPDIKRGNISRDEEDLIIRLHKLLGNRWSLIAGRLPGRTDNEIKNYWNTNICKRFKSEQRTHQIRFEEQNKLRPSLSVRHHEHHPKSSTTTCVVRTKATRCTKVNISEELRNIRQNNNDNIQNKTFDVNDEDMSSNGMLSVSPHGIVLESSPMWSTLEESPDLKIENDMDGQILSMVLELDELLPFSNLEDNQDGGHVNSCTIPNNNNLSFNEDVHGELDTDWIMSLLHSEIIEETSN